VSLAARAAIINIVNAVTVGTPASALRFVARPEGAHPPLEEVIDRRRLFELDDAPVQSEQHQINTTCQSQWMDELRIRIRYPRQQPGVNPGRRGLYSEDVRAITKAIQNPATVGETWSADTLHIIIGTRGPRWTAVPILGGQDGRPLGAIVEIPVWLEYND